MSTPTDLVVSSTDAYRDMVYHARFKAHVNVLYFIGICPIYDVIDFVFRWLIAIGASAAVFKWSIWTRVPWAFEVLSALIAIVAITNAVWGLQGKVATLVELQAKWSTQKIKWDSLWLKMDSGEPVTVDQIEALKVPEVELQKLEAPFLKFKFLINKSVLGACIEMGIDNPVEEARKAQMNRQLPENSSGANNV